MDKPRLFIRDWQPKSAYKPLARYFDLDIFEEITGEILEYDGFLLHHFSCEYDIDPLKRIAGSRPIVIETTQKGEVTDIVDDLMESGISLDDISIEVGQEKSRNRICSLFGFPPA